MGMRMCYSVDFGPAGKLKFEGGRLCAIMWHNCRIPRLFGQASQEGATPGADACSGAERPAVLEAEMTWKENIDPLRIGRDQIWFNPAYGNGSDGWGSPQDLPEALSTQPEKLVMDALHGLLGIDEVDGVLRYGEGKGDCGCRRSNPDADARTKRRRKARKAVRRDAVLSVNIVLQGSPFFFPKIREEGWTQERIDKSLFRDRGELDLGAVQAFREAGMAWAKARWGVERIAGAALHLDESCPHMHIVVVLERNGRLNVVECIDDGSADARAMLDAMKSFFSGIHGGMSLEWPTEGGRGAGETYIKLNREFGEDIREAEARKATIEQEVAQAEAEAGQKMQSIALVLQHAEASRGGAVKKQRLEEEVARKARERREADVQEARQAGERRKAVKQTLAEVEKDAIEKVSSIGKAVQWAEGWKERFEAEADATETKRACEESAKVAWQSKANPHVRSNVIIQKVVKSYIIDNYYKLWTNFAFHSSNHSSDLGELLGVTERMCT